QNSTSITINSDISITANYESETAQSGRVEILNLSSLYKTSDIKSWIDLKLSFSFIIILG
ncbi:MAG: hypothetical protein QNK96_03260, partial [Flavobacteriia bacterium]